MPLLAYTLTAALFLWLAHRFLRPLSCWAALILYLLPFTFAGEALLTGKALAPVDLAYQTVPLSWMKQQHGIADVSLGVHSDVSLQVIPWRKAVQWSLRHGEWGLRNPFVFSGDILLAAEQPAVFSPLTWIAALLPVVTSFTFTAAIALFVAALCAFFFARELGCGEGAALFAGAGWAFSTSIVLFLLVSVGLTWIWCPLVFLGVRRVAHHADLRSAAILTLAFTLSLASGHPESTLWTVVIALPYGLVELRTRRAIPAAIAAGVAALLLSAIHLLPFREAMVQTADYAHRQTIYRDAPRGVGAREALVQAATTFAPWVKGHSPMTGAAGFTVLVLALFAIRRSPFFAALFVVALAISSDWKPLATLLGKIPLLDIALPDRLAPAAAFALVMLAALAVGGLKPAAPLLGILIAERFFVLGDVHKSFDPRAAYPPVPIFQAIQRDRPFRIVGHGNAFPPGNSALYELEDVRGYTAMTMLRYKETWDLWCVEQPIWFNRIDDLTRPFLSFLNVRYAITWDRDPPPPGWREVARQRGSILLENLNFIERAFVPRSVHLGDYAGMSTAADFRERAWIEVSGLQDRPNGPGFVTIRHRRLGYALDADMDGDGWIVTSIPAWRGWRASVDGRRVETQIANRAFVAVHVPHGRHQVVLKYRPQSFVVGRVITFWSAAALAAAFLLHRRQSLLQ